MTEGTKIITKMDTFSIRLERLKELGIEAIED